MSDPNKTTGVEVVENNRDLTITTDAGSKEVREIDTAAIVVNESDAPNDEPDDEGVDDGGDDTSTEAEEGDGEGEEGKGDTEETGGDLGDWNPDDEAVRTKFDTRYFKDGQLNQDALSDEFWKNYTAAEDKDAAGLNPATYAYLKDTIGLSEESAKRIEKSLVALSQKEANAFYDKVGGKERYEKALAWARTNYTKPQQDRFNALRAKGGEAFDDAVDALMGRFGKANPARQQDERRGPPPHQNRRPSTPSRDVSGGGGSGSGGRGDGYKTEADYHADLRAAGRDPQKMSEVRRKLRNSPFARRGK